MNNYQTVILTDDQGRKHVFLGKAEFYPGDKRRIVNVKFTESKELPTGYYFESFDNLTKIGGE